MDINFEKEAASIKEQLRQAQDKARALKAQTEALKAQYEASRAKRSRLEKWIDAHPGAWPLVPMVISGTTLLIVLAIAEIVS